MQLIRKSALLAATAGALSLSACVPPAPQPTPTPTRAPVPAPTPASRPNPAPVTTTVPTPSFSNWMDAPQTPGDWTYRPAPAGGTAQFGTPGAQPLVTLRCDRAARSLELARSGTLSGGARMQVLTETAERTLDTSRANGMISARLGAQDNLFDAMAFSKGRIAIAITGLDTLYIPAWPEITRVIEDCR